MNEQVTQYIRTAPLAQQPILETLRQLIHASVPHVQEEFKWGRPIFKTKKDFAYLKTAKNYVTLGFFNFQKLADPQQLLEGTGKDMRHLKIKNGAGMDKNQLQAWFKAAAL